MQIKIISNLIKNLLSIKKIVKFSNLINNIVVLNLVMKIYLFIEILLIL